MAYKYNNTGYSGYGNGKGRIPVSYHHSISGNYFQLSAHGDMDLQQLGSSTDGDDGTWSISWSNQEVPGPLSGFQITLPGGDTTRMVTSLSAATTFSVYIGDVGTWAVYSLPEGGVADTTLTMDVQTRNVSTPNKRRLRGLGF